MKAIYVLYQRPYESPDCYVKWLIGRPGHWACLADPGASQIMVRKYLSVGQISKFIYQQIALDVLFQMRYGSLLNSNKQPSDSQRGWGNPCFHISLVLSIPSASKHASTIWSVTQSLFGGDKATIAHLKEEILSILGYKNFETFW